MVNRSLVFGLFCCFLLGCGRPPALTEEESHLDTARIAIEAGDNAEAMEALNLSIEVEPSKWAYYYRAKLHADTGNLSAAMADCEAGLAMQDESRPDWAPSESDRASEEDRNLSWLLSELKKPEGRRFKGANANPPLNIK